MQHLPCKISLAHTHYCMGGYMHACVCLCKMHGASTVHKLCWNGAVSVLIKPWQLSRSISCWSNSIPGGWRMMQTQRWFWSLIHCWQRSQRILWCCCLSGVRDFGEPNTQNTDVKRGVQLYPFANNCHDASGILTSNAWCMSLSLYACLWCVCVCVCVCVWWSRYVMVVFAVIQLKLDNLNDPLLSSVRPFHATAVPHRQPLLSRPWSSLSQWSSLPKYLESKTFHTNHDASQICCRDHWTHRR
jgi:hypothetical protein